ncbi:MAG: hypothetical protein UY23_C0001G0202 [Candidatus Jorgensenbacteria bacterium GW2011_GWA1_48_11]|uniref:Band 7 domain-containing protein n=1 Tax=Candidatus Jorgensenbacteria bacterium GW2011_GWA1_48_11 TaxID=1618660 RepID=A0A0G1UBS9_9BACT|nr:MAG: hypothetical protein UY23_C0001G0202 [Candidatus Jorgensenbacteria bacterium GW2011_GWA1_48_11]KKW12088.1 MAG: hypothetical protein UY51_C0005G0330 [Candidatus Jorgensenbacteria bacterium GW2011_GWB1_49_9]
MPGFLMFWGAILLIFFALVPFISVNVPAVTGLVLLNVFKDAGPKQKDNLRPVGPGIHLKWPWESVREENFFPLELVTEKFEETYAAWDGPLMLAKVSFQYQPTVKRLLAFIAVDKTTINEGFKGVFSSFLSETIGARELGGQESGSVFVRTHVKVVEQAVTDKIDTYKVMANGEQTSAKEKLEDLYGVNFRLFNVADIDYSPDYQQARSGKARMGVVTETAKQLIEATIADGKPTISGKEAVNLVLVEQGKAKKSIVEVEGGQADPLQRAAAILGSLMTAPKGGE